MTKGLIEELVGWGNSHGASLNPDVEIYYDETTGLSFRASKELARGSNVATCPYKISISYLNAIKSLSPMFSPHGDSFPSFFLDNLEGSEPHIIGHFFLMQQYILKEKSFWWPYICLLPQPDEAEKLGLPIWWSDEDLQFLESTNAEPAIKIQKSSWSKQFERGIELLLNDQTHDGKDFWNVHGVHFSAKLYHWAATIFGTRSFRASSSLPPAFHILDHVQKDNFSLLLPILDIGNHNGINNVEWIPGPLGSMHLHIVAPVASGAQVFNFYGNKSNSELLVGYGFILPKNREKKYNNDTFNLALKPTIEQLALRKTQHCYVAPAAAAEECMFSIRAGSENFHGEACFGAFSQGFVDMTICMVANQRETFYLSQHPEYCPESDPGVFRGPLYRAAIVFLDIEYKLKQDYKRLINPSIYSRIPTNAKQILALDYRGRQIEIIKLAMESIFSRLLLVHHNSFSRVRVSRLERVQRSSPTQVEDTGGMDSKVSAVINEDPTKTKLTYKERSFRLALEHHDEPFMLTLETAFQWLELEYPSVHETLVGMIAEDQDEQLPLDWNILIKEGWSFTFLALWLVVVWTIWLADSKRFKTRHKYLSGWLLDMSNAYTRIVEDASFFPAEKQEKETICNIFLKLLTGGHIEIPSSDFGDITFTNLAILVAQEESLDTCPRDGVKIMPRQRVLCIFRPEGESEAGISQANSPISP